jgi:methylthioribose-1-phosphate isomerase
MVDQDVSTNVKLSGFGADKIISETKEEQVVILTHCNTGALATAGHGTALGIYKVFITITLYTRL